ncbi:hypothetical protein [Cellulosimicrobium sp. CUA-896]|uniref:hypothetical protein n=1 Tax=Cellulosimicrobium sp. CUA-896 TaxID=1517881 RepID=UPI0011152D4B|nr:hypothetical protein [Cellulosimicrobium sp. CUA-896]
MTQLIDPPRTAVPAPAAPVRPSFAPGHVPAAGGVPGPDDHRRGEEPRRRPGPTAPCWSRSSRRCW